MFYFNCWINKFYSTILIFVFLYSEKRCHILSVFILFLNIACIMNGVTKLEAQVSLYRSPDINKSS